MSDDFKPVPFFLVPKAAPPACDKCHGIPCRLSCETRRAPAVAAPKRRPPVQRRMELLARPFRRLLEAALNDLHLAGFNPRVWETLRTPERGAWLAEQGRSKAGHRSMHCYGVAADVICGDHSWRCPRSCGFFDALGAAVKARGLTWGGDWGWDRPHVQAVSVAQQTLIRTSVDVSSTLRGLMEG